MSKREEFINRVRELQQLDALSRHAGLVVVFGRRRVGKTSLLGEWLGAGVVRVSWERSSRTRSPLDRLACSKQ